MTVPTIFYFFVLGSSSLSGDFLCRFPEPVTSSSALDVQQKSLLNEQQQRLETLHDATLSSDKENLDFLGNIGVSFKL